MSTQKINLRFGVVTLIILAAAISRLIPHPANFAPIGGMALMGAAYFSKRYLAYIIPVVSMWISDLLINNIIYASYFDHFVWFYSGSFFTYAAFILIVLVGTFTLKKIKVSNVLISALSASIIFFVVSNFGVWLSSGMYPHNFVGLQTCYIAGIPFFKNTILGDLVYTSAMFGIFELLQNRFPALRAVSN
ncbi:MAG: DUF6580 family putative transport protein [Bacteroidales bacterium]|jgi:hypothetical protein